MPSHSLIIFENPQDSRGGLKKLLTFSNELGPLQDRCSENLVTILLQQPSAYQLHPRASRIDPTSIISALDGDADVLLNSTATFEVLFK